MVIKFSGLIVKITYHIHNRTVAYPHRREHQNIFITERIEIRTFPHIAPLSAALCKNIKEFPMKHIFRAIQKSLRFMISACTTYHIISIFMLPYLRISEEICRDSFRRCQNRISFIFFKMNPIFTVGNALSLFKSLSIIGSSCKH